MTTSPRERATAIILLWQQNLAPEATKHMLKDMERHIRLAMSHERDACADVVQEIMGAYPEHGGDPESAAVRDALEDALSRIRARGEEQKPGPPGSVRGIRPRTPNVGGA